MNRILLFLFIAYSSDVFAEWFEVVGYSSVIGSDVATARQKAVKDAITQALIFSGASVSSVQTVADGVLSQDELKIKAHGQIQHVNLLNEQLQDEQYSVTLHLDIIAPQSQCIESQFSKQITITQSQLTQPHQARLGQIFDIPKASSARLYQTLNERQHGVKVIPYINKKIDVTRFFSQQFEYNQNLIETISNQSNSQYVLFSQITDIAQGKQLNSDYAFWKDTQYMRNFKVDFALYDAQTKDQVWFKHYNVEGIWPFEKTTLVDVNSEQFWQTDYGQKIQDTFNDVSQDMRTAIACLPTSGKILHIEGERLVINLGGNHGLKPGQTLSILHLSDMTSANGMSFSHHTQTIDQLVVEQVNAQSAVTKNMNDRPLSNIQLNDIVKVIIKEPPSFELH